MRKINHTGKRYGKLLVLRAASRTHWTVLCDCGVQKDVTPSSLRKSKSCGCLRVQTMQKIARARNTTHGMSHTRVYDMYNAAKQRARRKGIPFSIALEDIHIPDTCPLLGIPLVHGSKGFDDNSPSIDKVVPELGYVHGNVWVISMRANRIKQDASLEELKMLTNSLEVKYDVWPNGKVLQR